MKMMFFVLFFAAIDIAPKQMLPLSKAIYPPVEVEEGNLSVFSIEEMQRRHFFFKTALFLLAIAATSYCGYLYFTRKSKKLPKFSKQEAKKQALLLIERADEVADPRIAAEMLYQALRDYFKEELELEVPFLTADQLKKRILQKNLAPLIDLLEKAAFLAIH